MARKNTTQPQGPEPLPADAPPPEEPRRPVQEFRLGRIKAVVWENETQLGTRYSVAFRRLYKDNATDQWRQSTSFNRDDLPLVAKVADLAHTWIFGQIQSDAPF